MAWIRPLPFPELLRELSEYSNNFYQFSTAKAKRIWQLCVDQGHEELAFRIYLKHKKVVQSDSVIALGYALMASQIQNKPL